jgi:hypothetical protein
MAETTPGPLIMVLQFVGFMAAFRDPGTLSPLWAGTLGGLLATWVTFVPCFLWIFAGAPYIEALRGNKALGAALSAVVGVVLNLAIWFALHVLFHQVVQPRPPLALEAGTVERRSLGARVLGRRHGGAVSLQGRDDPDAARQLGRRRRGLCRRRLPLMA